MNRNRILLVLLGAAVVLPCLQSCWKEEEDIFDESASARVQNLMDECAEALVNSEYGWYMEMYPEADQYYGGWVHTFVFDGEKVKARSELFGADYEVESYYKMTNDNSAVLSFDTYNEVIHYLSTPSSSSYVGYEGEFEFSIMDVGSSVITLMGKKTGNTMYLRKLETDAESYLEAISDMDDEIYFTTLTGTLAGYDIEISLDLDYRWITLDVPALLTEDEDSESTVEVAYSLTDFGIRFYETITIAGQQISGFTLGLSDSGANTFISDEVDTSLEQDLPELWRSYASYEGNYTFIYNDGASSIDVTLTPAGDKSTYLMQGVNDYYDITMTYSKTDGTLSIYGQILYDATDDVGYYVGMTAYDRAKGYISYTSTVGMETVWNGDEDNPVYTFEDNGVWSSYTCTSLRLYYWTYPSISSSYRITSPSVATKYRVDSSAAYIAYLVNLTKN